MGIISSVVDEKKTQAPSKLSHLRFSTFFSSEAAGVGFFGGLVLRFSPLASWRLQLREGQKS